MKCKSCKDKGYVESNIARDNHHHPMILKCHNPDCPHINKYYKEIKDRFSSDDRTNQSFSYDIPEDTYSIKGSARTKDGTIDIDVPSNIVAQGQIAVSNYIANIIKGNRNYSVEYDCEFLDTNNEENLSKSKETIDQNKENIDQESPGQLNRHIEAPVFEHLEEGMVQEYIEMKEQGLSPSIAIATPFGMRQCFNPHEANRTIHICKKYQDHQEELSFAYEHDNVDIFPLGRALGFDE